MQVQAPEKVKASALPSGKLVELYIELRDRRARRKAAFENEDAEDKAKQEKIEGMLLQRFAADGVDSVKTAAGTAYTSTRTSATVADKEAFFNFLRDNDLWMLADIRASKTDIATFRTENDDLPPGINWSETLVVNVRRS